MTERYAIAHVDEIPELVPVDEVAIRPVRHHFGITAFGVNAWVAENAGDRLINEHTEDPGNEELYVVSRGRATFELDGERFDAPAGTFVHARADVRRTAYAEEAGTLIVAIGGTVGQPYFPVGWELWYPLRNRYLAGEHEEVVARLREAVAANPQYPLLFYNLACCESLTGRTADALGHLTTAIELSEQFRDYARNDSDLDALRAEPRFEELVGG